MSARQSSQGKCCTASGSRPSANPNARCWRFRPVEKIRNPTSAVSVSLVRQHRQRVELDAFLVQLLRLLGRGFAVDRAVLDLAVVHFARSLGKLAADVLGVLGEMVAQLPQLATQLALLRR